MPSCSPSGPTTRISFALISSLIGVSFVLIRMHLRKLKYKTKQKCEEVPRTHTSPIESDKYQRLLALRQGESGETLCFILAYYTTPAPICQGVNAILFSFFIKKVFLGHWEIVQRKKTPKNLLFAVFFCFVRPVFTIFYYFSTAKNRHF